MPFPREAQSPQSSERSAKRARTQKVASTRARRPLPSISPPPPEGVYVQAAKSITVAVDSDTQPLHPLARYKAWKRSGGLHDDVCFVCQEPGELVPCDTCRRSYHDAHKPPQSSKALHGDSSLWYCDVCVDRGWHVDPPMMTPPSSPQRMEISQAAEGTSNHTQHSASLDPSPARPDPSQNTPARLVSAEQPQNRAARSRNPPVRKSRFTTLPVEVDSALAVVYRELESVPILQTKVSELEAETKRLQQVVSMQRNEMAMMQTALNKTASLQAELQTLKAEAAAMETERSEKGELERKNRELEAELGRAKEELEERNRTLQEWKRKLSSLIGE